MPLNIKFPFAQQHEAMDCGPACLAMVARYYGQKFPLSYLRTISHIDREGVSLAGISEAAEKIGLRTMPVKLPFLKTGEKPGLSLAPLPTIVHWEQRHFVVVYKMSSKYVWIADPAAGKFKLSHEEFKKHWVQDGGEGISLLLEPSPAFSKQNHSQFEFDGTTEIEKEGLWRFLTHYFSPHKRLFWQLVIGLVVGSAFQLALPFVTQSVVDVGIKGKDMGFLMLILLGQFALFTGQTLVQFIQNWILLHIPTILGQLNE